MEKKTVRDVLDILDSQLIALRESSKDINTKCSLRLYYLNKAEFQIREVIADENDRERANKILKDL